MGAGGNGNNQWELEGNGNKTRLNLGSGMGMGMNHWEWEVIRLKKTFLAHLCSAGDSRSLITSLPSNILEVSSL